MCHHLHHRIGGLSTQTSEHALLPRAAVSSPRDGGPSPAHAAAVRAVSPPRTTTWWVVSAAHAPSTCAAISSPHGWAVGSACTLGVCRATTAGVSDRGDRHRFGVPPHRHYTGGLPSWHTPRRASVSPTWGRAVSTTHTFAGCCHFTTAWVGELSTRRAMSLHNRLTTVGGRHRFDAFPTRRVAAGVVSFSRAGHTSWAPSAISQHQQQPRVTRLGYVARRQRPHPGVRRCDGSWTRGLFEAIVADSNLS